MVYHTPITGILDWPVEIIYREAMNIQDTFQVCGSEAGKPSSLLREFSDYPTAVYCKDLLIESISKLAGDSAFTFWIIGTKPRRAYNEDGSYTLIE